MNEEQFKEYIKELTRIEFENNIKNNLDSSIIFKYIQGLEQEKQQLKNDLEFVLEQVLGAFIQNWCIDWNFADIREKYSIDDDYDWRKSNE